MRDGDELVGVRHSSGDDDVLMVSRKGQAVRFHEDARPRDGPRHRGRARHAAAGRRRGDRDRRSPTDDADLLVVTENGFGKRTRICDTGARAAAGWA